MEKERRSKVVMSGLEIDTNEPAILKEGTKGFINNQLQSNITNYNYKLKNLVGQGICINDDLTNKKRKTETLQKKENKMAKKLWRMEKIEE